MGNLPSTASSESPESKNSKTIEQQSIKPIVELSADDLIFLKIGEISNNLIMEYNNDFLKEDFCNKMALVYQTKISNFSIKLLKTLYNEINSSDTNNEIIMTLQYLPKADDKFNVDIFKSNLEENFWRKNIEFDHEIFQNNGVEVKISNIESIIKPQKYINFKHVNNLLSIFTKVNSEKIKVDIREPEQPGMFSSIIGGNNNKFNKKNKNIKKGEEFLKKYGLDENNNNIREQNSQYFQENNRNKLLKNNSNKTNERQNINNFQRNNSNKTNEVQNINNFQRNNSNRTNEVRNIEKSEENNLNRTNERQNINNFQRNNSNKTNEGYNIEKLEENNLNRKNNLQNNQNSQNNQNNKGNKKNNTNLKLQENTYNRKNNIINLQESLSNQRNKVINLREEISKKQNNSYKEIQPQQMQQRQGQQMQQQQMQQNISTKEINEKTNNIINKHLNISKETIDNKLINGFIKYSVPKNYENPKPLCNNSEKCSLTKKELCQAITENFIVRNNIIAAILTTIPFKNENGQYEGGLCYQKFINLDDCKVCVPYNFKELIEDNLNIETVITKILEKADNLDEKMCKDNQGYFFKLSSKEKLILAKKKSTLTEAELKNHPALKYNLYFFEFTQKLKDKYFTNLNSLILILEKIKENPIINNETLNIISNETKQIINEMYNLCHYYYVYAIISLINADVTEQRIEKIDRLSSVVSKALIKNSSVKAM
jgi:hypothetical protein